MAEKCFKFKVKIKKIFSLIKYIFISCFLKYFVNIRYKTDTKLETLKRNIFSSVKFNKYINDFVSFFIGFEIQ